MEKFILILFCLVMATVPLVSIITVVDYWINATDVWSFMELLLVVLGSCISGVVFQIAFDRLIELHKNRI